MDTPIGFQTVRAAPGLDAIVTDAIPFGPGTPGYEWVTDRLVLINPLALAVLRSGLDPEPRPAPRSMESLEDAVRHRN